LGEFVIVEADRGEDLGIVVEIVPAFTFSDDKHTAGHRGKGFATENGEIRKVLRIAGKDERQLLPSKAADENEVLEVCREKVEHQFMMPITVVDTEYQVDRHKLTIYYESQK
jgi:cell fate regulator YaaT (PSP1 superfamily)